MSSIVTSRQHHFGYLPYLDGMRGAAALAVMLFHGARSILPGGFIGVDVFFVLSGFLITTMLVREWYERRGISLGKFFARRALRLLPALVLLLTAYVIAIFVLPVEISLQEPADHLFDVVLTLLCVSNWPIALGLRTIPFLGHVWALAVEVQFYGLWALALSLLLRFVPSRRVIVGIILGIALFSWMERVYLLIGGVPWERLFFGLDTRLDSLMVGAALGVALSANPGPWEASRQKAIYYAAIVSALGLVIIGTVAEGWRPSTYYLVLPLAAVFSGMIVLYLSISSGGILRRVLESPVLVWIGGISYGLYLWHFPIFRVMQELHWRRLLVLGIGVPLTFAVAVASYRVLERPLLHLKNRFRI